MKTVSIINLKGGTGKTVTAVNMAEILADRGSRVLLIDADPQHNSSDFFGTDPDSCGITTRGLLEGLADYWPDCVNRTGREGIDIIPSEIDLIECDIASVRSGVDSCGTMAGFCAALEEDDAYDYVIIDCPPSFPAGSVAAVLASDEVIIPVKVDAFAFTGIRELVAQIAALRKIQPKVRIAGALITMWHNAEVVRQGEALLRASGIPVFHTVIRRTDKVDESTFAREPLHRYSKTSSAGRDYLAFVAEWTKGGGEA